MPEQRVVTRIPLTELFDSGGTLRFSKLKAIGRDEIASLLNSSDARFVVASCGTPLSRIPNHQRYEFWKSEVIMRLVEPADHERGFRLEEYAGGYCYIASEWRGNSNEVVVLLETHH